MKRRHFMLGAAAAAAGGAWLMRPGDEGAAYERYFARLNEELKQHGPMRPVMIVDLDRLDHNIDQITRSMQATKMPRGYRVVAKSVPSGKMIDYVMQRAGTRRLMAFHQPFLNEHARYYPKADILLGKPMPVQAAALFYAQHRGPFDPARQLQWLIDTPERMAEYLALAQGQGLRMRINIELDVGLHRGGVLPGAQLAAICEVIAANPETLSFSGFMGYDPHVVKVPGVLASRQALMDRVLRIYEAAVAQVRDDYPALWNNGVGMTLNTAGSPTYKLHEAETLCNDIAVGSALVKPTDFDIDTLDAHQPAAFIATPVLKSTGGVQIPGLDGKSKILSWWDINQRQTYFIYGGYWKARLHAPRGLRNNALYGHSTNQEMVTGSPATDLRVNDQVFLRPTQSEFVFLQFGDLLALRDGRIVDQWPVFNQS